MTLGLSFKFQPPAALVQDRCGQSKLKQTSTPWFTFWRAHFEIRRCILQFQVLKSLRTLNALVTNMQMRKKGKPTKMRETLFLFPLPINPQAKRIRALSWMQCILSKVDVFMCAELSLDHSIHISHHVKGYFNKKEQHLGCKKTKHISMMQIVWTFSPSRTSASSMQAVGRPQRMKNYICKQKKA